MYCPACGSPNSDDARFCNQCGVRIATMAPIDGGAPAPGTTAAASAPPATAAMPTPIAQPAHVTAGGPAPTMPGSPTASGAPGDGGATIQTRLPTMGGTQSIALPMSGPSRRTMIIAGSAIAVAGIALGALVAMRALKGNAPAPTPPATPENNVALVETPHVIGQGDGGVTDDAGAPSEQRGAHTGGTRTRTGTTASNGAGATTGTGGTGGTTSASAAGGTRTAANGTSAGTSGSTTRTGSGSSGSGGSGSSGGGGTTASNTGGGGSNDTAGGSGSGPTPGDLQQLNGGGSTTGGGIAPRGPSVGGYVQGEETDATGTMDPTVFSYVYRHYRNQVSACQSMVTRNAGITGTMRVRVRLGVDGHVTRTTVLSNTTNNTELATCIQNSIRTWAYPRPEGGEVEFDYNFGFGS